MKKQFGMEFLETDKGFTIEFSGDEETIKARKEAIQAWREFVGKAHKAMRQARHSHGHHCCCQEPKQDEPKEKE